MQKIACLIALLLIESSAMFAQVGINADNSVPDPNAMLDVKSTSKGALLPRLTLTQILTIGNPANGLIVYCTTDSKLYIYVSASMVWKEIAFGAGTIIPQSCGSVLTVNHFAGDVAPVTKTVTYGTVTNIAGETTKCWIARNLGASQQASAVNDATEASAGWYWQFNRKQGYQNTGGYSVTPPWTINYISENSEWLSTNDPCTIELGSAWRIPTETEWSNVDNAAGWTEWMGPWISALKLHAAGYLDANGGGMLYRGVYGYYWSSSQNVLDKGYTLGFTSSVCTIYVSYKSFGVPLRCIK
jgi:hypothetical protein